MIMTKPNLSPDRLAQLRAESQQLQTAFLVRNTQAERKVWRYPRGVRYDSEHRKREADHDPGDTRTSRPDCAAR